MKKIRKKLNLSNCIIIGDAVRISKGLPPIKNKFKLSIELSALNKVHTANSIYSKLYRYELGGFYSENKSFIRNICDILHVKESDLIINSK